jgi:hypothetical protein
LIGHWRPIALYHRIMRRGAATNSGALEKVAQTMRWAPGCQVGAINAAALVT